MIPGNPGTKTKPGHKIAYLRIRRGFEFSSTFFPTIAFPNQIYSVKKVQSDCKG
ncbi:hypothetical protein LEP1GSC058_1329 [Leptospira fainei serovar Hurstbridge str. BUT 6]|uniref:Uncharacterized protein n=1 Tax=Leptospira fainei serovar Hurstbridge str. BUT 6 TaxID=1193011 RepID=S3V6F9_9LEPT|nr:hypothetical protein LEP1GSC058_1329 [Leptospira fainei serovar Hurstbridge str. BUT 6]